MGEYSVKLSASKITVKNHKITSVHAFQQYAFTRILHLFIYVILPLTEPRLGLDFSTFTYSTI